MYFKTLCGTDLPKELLIQFFFLSFDVTHLPFQEPKYVGRTSFAKELPLTEYVLHFPCRMMLSLSASGFKGP